MRSRQCPRSARVCPRLSPQCPRVCLALLGCVRVPEAGCGHHKAARVQTRLRGSKGGWAVGGAGPEHGPSGAQRQHRGARGSLRLRGTCGRTPCQWQRMVESRSRGVTKAGSGLWDHQAQPPTPHCCCSAQSAELDSETNRLLLMDAVRICVQKSLRSTCLTVCFQTVQRDVLVLCCHDTHDCPAAIFHSLVSQLNIAQMDMHQLNKKKEKAFKS